MTLLNCGYCRYSQAPSGCIACDPSTPLSEISDILDNKYHFSSPGTFEAVIAREDLAEDMLVAATKTFAYPYPHTPEAPFVQKVPGLLLDALWDAYPERISAPAMTKGVDNILYAAFFQEGTLFATTLSKVESLPFLGPEVENFIWSKSSMASRIGLLRPLGTTFEEANEELLAALARRGVPVAFEAYIARRAALSDPALLARDGSSLASTAYSDYRIYAWHKARVRRRSKNFSRVAMQLTATLYPSYDGDYTDFLSDMATLHAQVTSPARLRFQTKFASLKNKAADKLTPRKLIF